MQERRSSTVAMRVAIPVDVTVMWRVAPSVVVWIVTPGGDPWLSGVVASRMDVAVSGSL